jgi:glycine/D-amino acid oxidase-like deaminating enzyme
VRVEGELIEGDAVVAPGLGASGLTMGPLAGSLAAQAALGLPPAIDLEPFAPPPALCRARRSVQFFQARQELRGGRFF